MTRAAVHPSVRADVLLVGVCRCVSARVGVCRFVSVCVGVCRRVSARVGACRCVSVCVCASVCVSVFRNRRCSRGSRSTRPSCAPSSRGCSRTTSTSRSVGRPVVGRSETDVTPHARIIATRLPPGRSSVVVNGRYAARMRHRRTPHRHRHPSSRARRRSRTDDVDLSVVNGRYAARMRHRRTSPRRPPRGDKAGEKR